MKVIRDVLILLLVAVLVVLGLRAFVVRAFVVPSQSMQPTLSEGSRVLVNEIAPHVGAVHRGDVIVFTDPGGWLPTRPGPTLNSGTVWGGLWSSVAQFVGLQPDAADSELVKRVIGVPGDTVTCCSDDGKLEVNGKTTTEAYLSGPVTRAHPASFDFAVTVPEGMLWVLGDNREHSQDSRAHIEDPSGGFVPERDVTGVVFASITNGRIRW